jgi:monofunctional biosynthetic peptidoglycan transglycosylase
VARSRLSGFLARLLWSLVAFVVAVYAAFVLLIVAFKWINPPTTSIQIERRVEAWRAHKPYRKRCTFVPLKKMSLDLRHAVVAAEDTRFSEHSGIDWIEVQKVLDQDMARHKLGRGGSTISQQLVKNLFLTANRSLVRKGLEFTLVPFAETILGKDRILELYLNVIEWGPGVYGAEAASRYWYNVPASQVNREQAARLASVIPNPRRRRPDRMDNYTSIILGRMQQMGW